MIVPTTQFLHRKYKKKFHLPTSMDHYELIIVK